MVSQEPVPSAVATAVTGLGHLSRRLHQVYTRRWQEQLGDEVTGPQFNVLGVLHTQGPMDQRTLSEISSLDKSTAAPVIERLRRRGLLEVSRDDTDRRRKVLVLTDQGRELVERLAPIVVSVAEGMLAGITAAERAKLLELLGRVARPSG
ncbi:MarR family winged helix-turn-helix transcriptional regulator [Amycolatopsis acidiphila]|uniref:MarR family winged helix-turn-helix transcriptional regulator n=1 Tax=Amycolatopsis acidiphila TaxID=715473 RepID=UPI001C972AC1|nr:MarR family winged helix-turn-helix transcriptional regulator [Amycolatopsis acidiphila]UIJ62786.1 MarR family winged helix-turn-helix transcriptional regulator [Amycolatopsis acidiphila]